VTPQDDADSTSIACGDFAMHRIFRHRERALPAALCLHAFRFLFTPDNELQ
jgi:hypothetical protein